MSQDRGVILLYHRVADSASDPFELSVTPRQFEAHLDFLRGIGPIVSLAELADAAREGALDAPAFAITFDDGYADNLHAAKPVLESRDVPATVFVTTDTIGGIPFWWDELGQLLLDSPELPAAIELELDGVSRRWEPVSEGRAQTHHAIWALLQPLGDADRRRALGLVREQVAASDAGDGRSLTREELAELARDGLVTVGAHTRTHPVLSALDAEQARAEVAGSKAWLEDVLGRAVTSFSYPFGGDEHYGRREVELVRDAGFERACSAMAGAVRSDSHPLELPRVTVGRWDVEDVERAVERLLDLTGHAR